MKTRAEIDELIARWLDDPDWELEESDGFEDHKDELLAVRHKHEAEWKARAQREHAEAIAALTGPALAILPVSAQRAAQTPGTNLHLALGMCAEMLLPIKQRLDRLDARVDANHDDLQQQIDLLRAALREVRS